MIFSCYVGFLTISPCLFKGFKAILSKTPIKHNFYIPNTKSKHHGLPYDKRQHHK